MAIKDKAWENLKRINKDKEAVGRTPSKGDDIREGLKKTAKDIITANPLRDAFRKVEAPIKELKGKVSYPELSEEDYKEFKIPKWEPKVPVKRLKKRGSMGKDQV